MAEEKKITKAYDNREFLHGRSARPLRVLAEFIEPEERLRKRGIWGRGDVMRHPNTVRSVLQYVYRLDVVAIQNRVRAAMERDKRR